MHLLSFEKNIFFNGDMSQVFGTLCCFSSRPFLKQLASHVSADTFQLKFRGMKFFLIHPGNLNIFLEGFKVFCAVLMKDKSTYIKNKSMMVKTCFFNVLFQLL